MGNILAGRDLRDSITRLAASAIALGASDIAARRSLEALMDHSQAPRDERWKARVGEIPRAISGARAKFSQAQLDTPFFDPWQEYVVPPFPLDILPGAVQRFVETQSRVIGCHPSLLAMSVLANFSGALDHRFALKMLRNGNWHAHPRLWVLILAQVSAKKTPAFRAATRHLEDHQNGLWDIWDKEFAIAKDADPKTKGPPKPPRFVVGDTTIEPLGEILSRHDRGVLVRRDEIAGWIGGMEKYGGSNKGASADRAFWLQAYDGGPHTVDRINRGEQRIRNLSVSLIGGIQPERLKELHGLTSDGLLQQSPPMAGI